MEKTAKITFFYVSGAILPLSISIVSFGNHPG
jgi:hypothetical protein